MIANEKEGVQLIDSNRWLISFNSSELSVSVWTRLDFAPERTSFTKNVFFIKNGIESVAWKDSDWLISLINGNWLRNSRSPIEETLKLRLQCLCTFAFFARHEPLSECQFIKIIALCYFAPNKMSFLPRHVQNKVNFLHRWVVWLVGIPEWLAVVSLATVDFGSNSIDSIRLLFCWSKPKQKISLSH